MPIYRCAACGYVAEEGAAQPGTRIPCAKCTATCILFSTPLYVERLAERYLATRRELDALKIAITTPVDESSPDSTASTPASLALDDLHNSSQLATEAQHEPLGAWFKARKITATHDLHAVDTIGFFDDAAREIGDHHDALAGLLQQISYAYRQDFTWINADLSRTDPLVRQNILGFCRELYGHTLFTRYSYQRDSQTLGLGIQPAQAVRAFFLGEWLEWYALTTLLTLCLKHGNEFSCARRTVLTLANDETRELDVTALISGRTLLVIECKTGEFRGEIGKYVKMRQRLGLDRTQFIVCSTDLTDDQAAGLGAMYGLTFVNLASLRSHLAVFM
jgi:rubredoxin